MNDHDARLRAIGQQPDEDTPRLAYADWLEENGQPDRADFVRNQIALNRTGLTEDERYELVRKNVFYLNHWVPAWKAELPWVEGIEWGDFRRGLVEEVLAAGPEPVVVGAAAIFAVPGVHILRLRWLTTPGRSSRAAELARVPQLERLRSLRLIASRAEAPALRELLASPHLGRLTVLDLHGNRADDAVARDLADGRFTELSELWLGSNLIGDDGARALAASSHLTGLRRLDLRGNNVRAPGARTAVLTAFGSRVTL